MKGILINSEQIKWFKSMFDCSYGTDNDDIRQRIIGALEMVIFQPQEEWVHALTYSAYSVPCVSLTDDETRKPIFPEEIDHKKGDE